MLRVFGNYVRVAMQERSNLLTQTRSRLGALTFTSAVIVGWFAAIYAAAVVPTRLARFEIPSICGPWGCTAETNDLVAYHLVWLAFVLPPACWFSLTYRSRMLARIGWCVVGVVLLVAVGVMLFAGIVWQRNHPETVLSQPWRYGLFLLFSNPDVPVLPTLGCGVIFSAFGGTAKSVSDLGDQVSEAEA